MPAGQTCPAGLGSTPNGFLLAVTHSDTRGRSGCLVPLPAPPPRTSCLPSESSTLSLDHQGLLSRLAAAYLSTSVSPSAPPFVQALARTRLHPAATC